MNSDSALEFYYDRLRSTPAPASLEVSRSAPVRDASLGAVFAMFALTIAVSFASSLQKNQPPTVLVGAREYAQALALEPQRRPEDSLRGERWTARIV